GEKEVITDFDQIKAIDEGFNASTWIYAIIAKNAKKFSSIPRYLYDEEKLMEEKAAKAPYQTKAVNINKLFESDLNKLLDRPNEYQGMSQFLCTLYAFYLACGEAFIWLNRGDVKMKVDERGRLVERTDKEIDLKPILEMYVLPTQYMKVYTDPENVFGVSSYCLEVAGTKVPFRKGDIIHWKDLNLKFDATTGEHLRGMTRLKPGAATTTENKELVKGAVRRQQNDGAKGILWTKNSAEEIGPAQESQIRQVVNAKVNSNDIRGAVALLTGLEWDYINIATGSEYLNDVKVRVKNEQELCALFDTPHLLFVPTDATLANLENAKKNWINDAIIPPSKELDDLFNLRLLPPFQLVGKAKIISDFTELPEMQQDMGKMVTALSAAWWLSPNQKLIAQGYEARTEEEFNEPWIIGNARPLSKVIEGFEDDGFNEIDEELKKRGLNR
ncbi:MAG TPA: phage portal protein, partial [Cyclobacteriaceae bacterium]|nr:phage portal protein [Cyclobacteriaceae bacterium]